MIKEEASTIEQKVYELVKAKIVNLEWKPGQFINDQDVASELGISRTPVRDAFHRLEFERLLNRQTRKGWQVSPLTINDISEIFVIKEGLQGILSFEAARCTNQQLRSEFEAAAERMRITEAQGDQAGWEEAHNRFHEILMHMANYPNGRVVAILNQLNDQWRRVRRGLFALEGYRSRETVDHLAIAKAILDHDSEAAERLTRQHLDRVRDELLTLLEHLVFPFASNGI